MVAVLPRHDPLRVAEQVAMLDVLSNGRTVLGMGRGTGRIEFEGFRVAMPEARGRFAETAEMLLNGLEQGFCEYDGKYVKQPRVDLRPRPYKSFKGRTYAAAISTESAEIMAKMGVGILIVPQKPWPVVQKELTQYRSTFFAATGEQAPGPYCAGWMFIDDSADRAEEMARRYIGAYWDSVIDHYEFNKDHLKNTAGYEFHGEMYDRLNAPGGMQKMTDFYVDLQIWGTPDQVFDKVQTMRENTLADGFMAVCSYGGMPHDEANRNMQQFAKDVMPELKKLTPVEAPLEQTA